MVMHKNEIVLIRGLPGSGKSTMARKMEGYIHLEADMFLEVDGVYVYEPSKVRNAHDCCVEAARKALGQGSNVVVSNTFVKLWEMKRYIDLGYPYRIIETRGRWPNIHGVAEEKIAFMAKGWESLPAHWAGSTGSLLPRSHTGVAAEDDRAVAAV